jgi:acyl carrier protein
VYNRRAAAEELIIVAEVDAASGVDHQTINRKLRTAVYDHTGIEVSEVRLVEPGWLVKTTSGKISRELNRKKWLEEAGNDNVSDAAAAASYKYDTFDTIRRIICQMFGVRHDQIKEDTVAEDVRGWDSLAHATVVLEIEQAFSIKFHDDEIFGFSSVGELVARTAELSAKRSDGGGASRIVYESERVSIVCYGAKGDNPDLIIFSGMTQNFCGKSMMDFASTLSSSEARTWRKLFVTDKEGRYFPTAEAEIAPAINRLCPGPKILVGNSMGGYGALKTASYLERLRGVLAFVPIFGLSKTAARRTGLPEAHWQVTPAPGVPYSILFGEVQNAASKEWIRRTFVDVEKHRISIVPNIGHRLVRYLDRKELLAEILVCSLESLTMNDRVQSIVARVEPSLSELRGEVDKLGDEDFADAWEYLCTKELELVAAKVD